MTEIINTYLQHTSCSTYHYNKQYTSYITINSNEYTSIKRYNKYNAPAEHAHTIFFQFAWFYEFFLMDKICQIFQFNISQAVCFSF